MFFWYRRQILFFSRNLESRAQMARNKMCKKRSLKLTVFLLRELNAIVSNS
jgi:hypothetical protein